MGSPAVQAEGLCFKYPSRRTGRGRSGERVALADFDLRIEEGELFALLGPNGSGKTTLFRLLSTLVPLQAGRAWILGHDIERELAAVRSALGVLFQAPSLDGKLTVMENLTHQGRLYGLGGAELGSRQRELLGHVGLTERAGDVVDTLSGGLRRRAELAKSMLHRPRVLLLDEPSAGLDPGARNDLWEHLLRTREQTGLTVVATTHLLDEADRTDRIGILDGGRLVALDTPTALRATVGGDTITIQGDAPERLAAEVGEKFSCEASVLDGSIRLEQPDGHQWIARLMEAFGDRITSIRVGRPTLEDVFIDRTGHTFWEDDA